MDSIKQGLWIVTELFPPEETSTGYIMGEIANAMSQKYEVKVICGPKVYDPNKKNVTSSLEVINPFIEVVRVNGIAEDKNSKLSRIKKFLLMSWYLYREAKKRIQPGERVLMVTNPFPLIVLMANLRNRRHLHLSMLAHDIMPESLYTDMHIPMPIYKIAEKVFNKAYAHTDLLISIGRDMSEILEKKVQKGESDKTKWPRITVIENWGDTKNIKPVNIYNADKITIQYAGNIGNAQGIGEFIDVMHDANCNQVEFGIWGTGSAELSLKEKVKQLEMSGNVMFHGPYSRADQQDVLNVCDIALVRLVEGMYGLGVPSKSYNILAAGKPILYIGERNTEIWRLIEENGNGVCFEPNDREGLIKYLRDLSLEKRGSLREMGKISRQLAEEKFSKEAILNRFLEVIN